MSIADLHRHRMALIPLRSELREVQGYLSTREAEIALGIEGKNAEERKARTALAVDRDGLCTQLRADAERLGVEIETHEGEIEYLRDLRRDHEWNIRSRLAAAIDGRGLPAEQRPDDSFDAVADEVSVPAIDPRAQPLSDDEQRSLDLLSGYPPRSAPPLRRNTPVFVADEDLSF